MTKTLDFVQREAETHDTNDIKTSDVVNQIVWDMETQGSRMHGTHILNKGGRVGGREGGRERTGFRQDLNPKGL